MRRKISPQHGLFIGEVGEKLMHDVMQNVRILAAAGAIGIYHHGTQTDRFWQAGEIDRVEDYIKCMPCEGDQC